MEPAAPDDLGDEALAVRSQHGDQRAFAELLRRHDSALRRTALRRTGSRADADDVVQETALKAWQSLHSLRDPAKVRAWLLQIAARKAVTLVVSRRQEGELDEHAAVPGPYLGVDRLDLHEGVLSALRALPAQQAQAWLLREVQGLSYREIGLRLDGSETTVRGWLVLARRRVQQGVEQVCPTARPARTAPAVGVLPAPLVAIGGPPPVAWSQAGAPGARPTAEVRTSLHQDLELAPAAADEAAAAAAAAMLDLDFV